MSVPGVASKPVARMPAKAPRPLPRPDRKFYASSSAFGRFGMRWFRPQTMPKEHFHGHIELNWLTAGSMDYVIDGHPLTLAWLGSVAGHSTRALGVEHFGQTGTIPELYRHYGIDAQAIISAAEMVSPGRPIRRFRATA